MAIHGRKGEIWFFLFDKVPCSLFGKSFASEVATIGVLECFFSGDVIPVFLGVDVAWSISLCRIDDGSEGACDDLSTWVDFVGFLFWEGAHTTRLTVGAYLVMALSIPVVPMMAGSRRSFFISVTLRWYGDEVWITTSNGGSDLITSSKAPSVATSSTMTKSSFSFVIPGCALWISAAFSRDLTLVTTECPCSSRTLRTWVATKPLPPVFCFSVRCLRRMHGWKPDLWEIHEPCFFQKVRGLLNLAEYIDKQNTEESLDDKLISNTLRSTAGMAADGKKFWMEMDSHVSAGSNRYLVLSLKLFA